MKKISKKYISDLLEKLTAFGFILAVFVIPVLHSSECGHDHAPSGAHDFYRHIHSKNEHHEFTESNSAEHHHDSEHCPICFFMKYLSGIKYYTLFPAGKIIEKAATPFTPHIELIATCFVQSLFNSRAPPL